MKKLAVVTTSTAFPGEKGLNRMFYLAELLCKRGYAVDFITSDFQHWTKSHRDPKAVEALETPCRILLAHEPGYTKNVQIKRIFSHRTLAKNIKKLLQANTYDLVYCDIPDNYVAATAAKYAQKQGIPFVVDVEDLWPEAMKMAFHVPVISDVLFSYFSRDAKKTYKRSSGVIGSSDTYRDTPLKYKVDIPLRATVYVGNDLAAFDKGAAENAEKIQKPEGEFWVTYAGTLGTSYDIPTLIRAVDLLKKQGHTGIRAMILGDGPLRGEFEALAKELEGDVTFAGYLPHGEMAAYLVRSDVVINSVVKNAPQSIVSKIGDYLAAKTPMINTCVDPEFWKKVEDDGFGLNVLPEDPQALADTILKLKNDPKACAAMSDVARRIAEEQFDRPKAFGRIVDMVDQLLK